MSAEPSPAPSSPTASASSSPSSAASAPGPEPIAPSTWSRLPGSASSAPATAGDDVDVQVEKVRAAVRTGAEEVATRLGRGWRRATDRFAAPTETDLQPLMSGTDLPELVGGDPIISLAQRLDREADLWRGLAMRSLARVGWADRIAQGVGLLVVVGAVALAAVAGLGALFGASALERSVLVAAAMVVLIAGAVVVGWLTAGMRRTQKEIARESFARADLAEMRLHRVAVLLALAHDPAASRDALLRLERDITR